MNNFSYLRAASVGEAVSADEAATSRIIAGGTNLVDLMKYRVENPESVIDITRLALDKITETPDGGLRLGALVTNAVTAYDDRVSSRYPVLSEAILSGASAQLRNMATNGGNLLQRTRCYYFYDTASPCNKRDPGSGCPAIDGHNRIHAILGASRHCIATHPSDMCVALAALDATVNVTGSGGDKQVPFLDFHRLPGNDPARDTHLVAGDVITSIDLPAADFSRHATYLKLRDRESYAFALVSVAACLQLDGDRIRDIRVALGGVAHKPWRNPGAEEKLKGQRANEDSFSSLAIELLQEAKGYGDNNFKIPLARRAIVRALISARDKDQENGE